MLKFYRSRKSSGMAGGSRKDFLCITFDPLTTLPAVTLLVSTHRLRIEHGRYCGENTEDRVCDSCNVVENEINHANVKDMTH